jgi:hypothetical protein
MALQRMTSMRAKDFTISSSCTAAIDDFRLQENPRTRARNPAA